MKFNIKGNDVELVVNGKKQTKLMNKVRLADLGLEVNKVVEEAKRKKKAEAKSD